jgi:diguanylate cyclase (GGDEF)-like protein
MSPKGWSIAGAVRVESGAPSFGSGSAGNGGNGDEERSRTLLVRDGPGLRELAEAIRRSASTSQLEEVNDLYEAMTELTASHEGTAAPVTTLAMTVRSTGDAPEAAREAIRIIDPAVRLVLLSPRGSMNSAMEAGFDQVLPLPAGSADLAAALQIETETAEGGIGKIAQPGAAPMRPGGAPTRRGPGDQTTPATTAHMATGADYVSSSNRSEPGARPVSLALERDVVEMVIGDAISAFAARRQRGELPSRLREPDELGISVAPLKEEARRTPPAEATSDSLGDTDLVDAVIEGGDRLQTLAMMVLRRELGSGDVQFVSAAAAAAGPECFQHAESHRAAVRCSGRTYGYVESALAETSELQPWADWLGRWMRLDASHQELRILAWTDELTGAGNRRAFERVLEETIAEARRERRSFSLMYFDIDEFKSYNDRFGHDAGDEVLREVVELLRAVIRRGDHVFRIGGDEFVVIFADVRPGPSGTGGPPLERVSTIANRFRDRVCDLKLSQLGMDAVGTLSVSAGVATYPWDGHDAHTLLSHADQLALQSKRSGKNAITFGPGARTACDQTGDIGSFEAAASPGETTPPTFQRPESGEMSDR